ncbi:MAG TPA: hypothetical protein VMZ69_08270 [Saprospiraceae bacterium]|nr:hypothetical protein [Saprospiraceae bacterium]
MKYKNHFGTSILLLLAMLSFIACDIINPAESIPARVQLEPINFVVQPGQGSAQQKITELWTFADAEFVGAFAPPTEIHYFADEVMKEFTFEPGIRNNGILDAAIIYPLFTSYTVELNTTAGNLSVVTPIIGYKPEAVFSLVSDFELQNDFVDNRDSIAESVLVRSAADPFEGNFSGEIILTPETNIIEVGNSIGLVNLPVDGTPTYLEFHYKSETEMWIGLLGIPLSGSNVSNFFYLLKPSEDWNKIYIELTDWLEVSSLPAYKILFRASYPSSAIQPSYKIQVDNIKVVHL